MFYLFLKSLVLPPGIFLLASLGIIASWRRWPRFALGLLCVSTLILWALSTVFVGKLLARAIEPGQPLSAAAIERFQPQAIILLGADRITGSPEYAGEDAPGGNMMIRMRYAARLQRETGLPLLVTGGRGYHNRSAQADTVADILQQEFHVPVRWREGASLTTLENAAYSREVLAPLGIDRILLVTQGFHMARATAIFEQFGFQCLPAPTGFEGRFDRPVSPRDFYPGMAGLRLSTLVLHELLGRVYYQLRPGGAAH